MRLTTSAIAGFIAIGVATPGGLTTIKPTSTGSSVDAAPAQPTPAHTDGNWHIGCDENNYCSYYQDSYIAAGSTDTLPLRTINLSESTCKQCTNLDRCNYCDNILAFRCQDCDHYYCHEDNLYDDCFDIDPALAEVIRNGTVAATLYETATSTTVETSYATITVSAVEVTTITVSSTPTSLSMPTSEPIVTFTRTIATKTITATRTRVTETIATTHTPVANTITHTVFSTSHSGTAPRSVADFNGADVQLPVRRNAAFTASQCVPCDAVTCPDCHDDCVSCEKFLCADLATHLSVCMSVRSKWQPPSFNISAEGPSETTTVVVVPQPGPTTTTQTVIYSTAPLLPQPCATITTSVVVAPLPPAATTQTVIYSTVSLLPRPYTTITTSIVVAPLPPAATTRRVFYSTVPLPPQPYTTTTKSVVVAPPRSSTVTVVVQRPPIPTHTISIQKSTVTVERPASTVVYHYQDPASTVLVQGPTVTASRPPTVFKIPMTVTSTATHTVVRSVRAVQTSVPTSPRDSSMAESICDTCNGNPDCDGCDFACAGEGDCFHFLCKYGVSKVEVCVSIPEEFSASKANDTSMAPGDFLGSAAMLLALGDVEDLTINTSASHIQPAVSNGTRPNFAFAEEDCYLCESDDESCGMCDWQFTCGTKKRCFHNGAREVVDMCFEQGEKCRP